MIYKWFPQYGVVESNRLTLSLEESSLEDVAGLVILIGSVCASAYLVQRKPVAQAISDIKGTSVKFRKAILCMYLKSCPFSLA
jgi:hypothetical protein